MRIVRLLVGKPPQTVADLIKLTGVTRTAVTEQLNELVAAGFVDRGTESPAGRGRPRHTYSATNAALCLLFAGNQQLVVPAMWRAIEEAGGEALSKKVLRRVSRALAEHYSRQITVKDPKRRFRQLIELLGEEGVLVEAEQRNGNVVLSKRSCPFITMLDESHSVCCVDQAMMTQVVGRPVRRTACRYEGDPCCTFEIAGNKKK